MLLCYFRKSLHQNNQLVSSYGYNMILQCFFSVWYFLCFWYENIGLKKFLGIVWVYTEFHQANYFIPTEPLFLNWAQKKSVHLVWYLLVYSPIDLIFMDPFSRGDTLWCVQTKYYKPSCPWHWVGTEKWNSQFFV